MYVRTKLKNFYSFKKGRKEVKVKLIHLWISYVESTSG